MTLTLENNESRQLGTAAGEGRGGHARVRILDAVADFEEYRDAWAAWSNRPEAGLDLFVIHLRHAQGVIRPFVMVVSRNGSPDCILVGWLEQSSLAFKVGAFILFRSNARVLRFMDGGFLGNQSLENSRLLIGEIMRSLQNQDFQAVQFSQLRLDSPLHALARREPNLFCRDHFVPVQTHRYLVLPSDFEEYFRGLSKKSRQVLKRSARLLARDFPGKARFQSIRNERDAEDFIRMADEISRKTYQRALGVGFVDNLETREKVRAAAQNATLRACLLYVDEQPIAFAWGLVSNKTLYGNSMGFDPEFKKYRPGLQTLMHLIEESFEPNGSLLRIDAGCGDPPYKRRLFRSSWKEHPVWIFAPTARGLQLHALKMISTMLHFFAMSLLAKSDLLRKARKIWRRKVVREFQRGCAT